MISLVVYFILLGLGALVVIKYQNYKSKEFKKWRDERINEVKDLLDERLERIDKVYNELEERNKECKSIIEDKSIEEEYKKFINNCNEYIEYMKKEYK